MNTVQGVALHQPPGLTGFGRRVRGARAAQPNPLQQQSPVQPTPRQTNQVAQSAALKTRGALGVALQKAQPNTTPAPNTPAPTPSMPGDVNGDGQITMQDGKDLVSYLFHGGAMEDMANADVNGDGHVNISDATTIFNMVRDQQAPVQGDVDGDGQLTAADGDALMEYLFRGGEAPQGLKNADVNNDGSVNISDVVRLLNLTTASAPESKVG